MATPISWAHEVIKCNLCDKATQQFCNNCQVSLCVNCINKHVDNFNSLTHEIVPFKNRKNQIVFPECDFQSEQRCEAHCQKCDVSECMEGVIDSHNGPKLKYIPKIFLEKRKEIEKEIHEFESYIFPMIKKIKLFKPTAIFEEMEQQIKEHRKSWHVEVDTIFDRLGTLIKSMKENHMSVLKLHQSKLINLPPDLMQTIQRNKEILKSNKVSDITNYKSKLTEYRNIHTDIDQAIPSLKTNTTQGRELIIKLGEYKVTLTQTKLSHLIEVCLDKSRVIATIPAGFQPLWRVACLAEDKGWVSGEDTIRRCVDIYGSIYDTVTMYYQMSMLVR
ncbi:uncharacterized protein LOC133194879 [Saccostrea echinata]|uniref:uncharacterized protein LOC133194879 n=1 Tax=Saccostrea echinata TaxID=191078 RepID=UPI002A84126E|nr:uncharacterized protein LOC133194879 [Saccostrea echinata]